MNDNCINRPWKTACVFISSTFVDMHEERDVLNSYVLPKLNEHFTSKRITVQLVDLRWGVQTSEIEDESARDNKVLSVCFDEIDRSQPFFVAILGDRYGYDKLDKSIVDAVSYRFNETNTNYSRGLQEKSVTELEILYGALLHPEKQLHNSVFCMRHADYSGMPEIIKEEYTLGVSKMASLRKKVVESCAQFNQKESIIDYNVSGWDNSIGCFESFDKIGFGELLYSKLVASISEHFDSMDATSLSFPEQLMNEQESFLSNTNKVVGMNSIMQQLLEQPAQLIIVQGESGIGKTTLFKYLARHLVSEGNARHVLYYNAGLSARCRDVKNMLIYWIWQVEQILDENAGDYEELTEEELRVKFECILQKGIELGHDFWLVIDSYDSFYKNAVSESLSFIRFSAKSFVSTQLGTEIRFHRDIDTYAKVLEGLNLDEAKEMMIDLFGRLHKEWNSTLWEIIQNKFEKTISPLWIELAVDVLSSLSAKDFSKIKALQSSVNNGSEALEKYLNALVGEFPSRVDQMFAFYYNQVMHEEGWSLEEQFYLWYISLSRNGIRESDLAVLTKQNGNWDSLLFARMRYRFRSCIKEKGVDNCWGFSHELYNHVMEIQIKKAGERMNEDFFKTVREGLDDHAKVFFKSYTKKNDEGMYVDFLEMLHGALGHHFIHCEQQYDLRNSECIYHLIKGNDKEATVLFLLSSDAQDDAEGEFTNAVREIADYIIDNNIDDKKCLKVPKGMPIPVIGGMRNPAVIWLMDLFNLELVKEYHCCGQLLLIMASAVTEVLNERGASSASLFLNLQLQSEVANKKSLLSEEQKRILAILIGRNVEKAQHECGESYDVVYQKKDPIYDDLEKGEDYLRDNETSEVSEEVDCYVDFCEKIYAAQKEVFVGDFNNAISICKELQKNDDFYSRKMPETLYAECKQKLLMCMADSYHALGQNQQAFNIYDEIEASLEKGSREWFLVQERLFQICIEIQDPFCFDVAKQHLSFAEHNFNINKTIYDNIETLAHSLAIYIKALLVLDNRDERIEPAIMRSERFFYQILHEFKYHKTILVSFSIMQEIKGDYYHEIGEMKEAEQAFLERLAVCEFIYGREPMDHTASRDFIKANEDLGYFYLSRKDYLKASDYLTDAIHFISRWDDSEEKRKRMEDAFSALCQALENMGVVTSKEQMANSKIRMDGHGYYYMSCKEYLKACDCFEDAIRCFSKWEDSEEKQLRLAEVYVALCYTMAYVDLEHAKTLIAEYKIRIESFSLLYVRQYFINQLEELLSGSSMDDLKLSV